MRSQATHYLLRFIVFEHEIWLSIKSWNVSKFKCEIHKTQFYHQAQINTSWNSKQSVWNCRRGCAYNVPTISNIHFVYTVYSNWAWKWVNHTRNKGEANMLKPSCNFLSEVPRQCFFCWSVFYVFVFVILSCRFLLSLWTRVGKRLTSWLSCV